MTNYENNALIRRVHDSKLERKLPLPVDRSELVSRARGIIGDVFDPNAGYKISDVTTIETPSEAYFVVFVAKFKASGDSSTSIIIKNTEGDETILPLDYPEDLDWADAYAAGELILEAEKQAEVDRD